jgi:hypothetical protein
MTVFDNRSRIARWAIPVGAAVALAGGLGFASAATHATDSASSAMNMQHDGMGMNGFGMTGGNFKGDNSRFTYTKGYWCDLKVDAKSNSGCEVGAKWKRAPSKQHDPLFITVPLGFKMPAMHMECPNKLTCIDHPGNMDLTRLAKTLAPIFGTTAKKLRPALRNFETPGHDHFISDKNMGKKEWWDVRVIGVTSKSVYNNIQEHQSYAYIQKLQKNRNKHVTAAIPTNLFLYFAAR